MKKKSTDLLVIGAGPGGMAAALKAREAGVNDVLIIDRLPELGGILQQCVHNGFGLHKFKQDLTGPEYAGNYADMIKKSGIQYILRTMAIEMSKDGKIIASNSSDGLFEISPKAIVLAMGCRERTRQQVSIPGTRPSGIFTAGVAQRLMNIEGYIPGKEVVIVGSGDIGLIMARRMTLEGAKVHAVTEFLPYPGGLSRNIVQCLNDFDIPLHLRHNVIKISGKDRVEEVEISKLDDNGRPIDKTFTIKCDTLLFSVGLIPENELSRMVELEMHPVTGGPVIDDNYMTSRPGTFICGNAAFVNDLADYVSSEAEVAGESAARFIGGSMQKASRIPVVPGENVRFITPNYLSRTDKVTLYMRVTRPMTDVTLTSTDDIVKIKKQIVKPSEMVEVQLDAEKLKKIAAMKEFKIDVR
jgi:NADPH-dependent 2,4-dienoyl-CoA reductase/sulfur reductase-like enzyme